MAPVIRSRGLISSAAKNSRSTCKTRLGNPRDVKKASAQPMKRLVKIVLRVNHSHAADKSDSEEPLSRKIRIKLNVKSIHGPAEIAPVAQANAAVPKKANHIVKFHRGTTLILRHAGKKSILRNPNRWTRVN